MFSIHRFFYKPVALSESDCVPNANLAHFQDLEKSRIALDYVPPSPQKPYIEREKQKLFKLLFFILALVFTFFCGPAIINKAGYRHKTSTNRPIAWAEPPENAVKVDIKNLKPKCSSGGDVNCKLMMDGDLETFWKSDDNPPPGGHTVIIDLLQDYHVTSLTVRPDFQEKDKPGFPYKHLVEVSTNKNDWIKVATGTWRADGDSVRFATFEPSRARYVRLSVFEMTKAQKFVTINELEIFHIPTASTLPPAAKVGRWGITLNFPIVPVSAFFNPINGELVTLSSFAPDTFNAGEPNPIELFTRSATWNPKTGIIGERTIVETSHDMFCPGTSFDKDGQVLVTGGTTPYTFSIFNPRVKPIENPAGEWEKPKGKFEIARGYAGQTYVADGTTFMIGGAWGWAGKVKHPTYGVKKDGEVYDPVTDKWSVLSGVKGESIKMDVSVACKEKGDPQLDDCVKTEWQLHHPWLFAWKGNSIFHAGPSKKMHWFHTTLPNGRTEDAGTRADDGDAVCAVTSMYDAAAGLILTAGGAPNYHYWVRDGGPVRKEATANAFEIKLGDPDKLVTTTKLKPMKHQRIFANGVILPTGETLVVGGQCQGEPFHEETWQPIPEIYTPGLADPWREVAPHITPRVYHSWALLTVNATVLVGGGGLSGDLPQTSRFDAQIYEPPYLFDSAGRAKQPAITKTFGNLFTLHDTQAARTIKITTDVVIKEASLLRNSAVTHTLNNDMRRIKLDPRPVTNEDKTYTLEIPDDPGVALPGYWMLFVLANGVPSKAETMKILVKPKP